MLVALLVLVARNQRLLREVFHPALEPTGEWYTVVHVVDGDTLLLDRNPSPALERGRYIRLIGVDTPETVHPSKPVEYFGREAAEFTRRLCEGRRVRLAFDRAAGQDHYGRTLAYVYLEDGTLLNAEIIRQGYGFAETRFPHSRLEEFRELERQAREQHRGLWQNPP